MPTRQRVRNMPEAAELMAEGSRTADGFAAGAAVVGCSPCMTRALSVGGGQGQVTAPVLGDIEGEASLPGVPRPLGALLRYL